MKTTINRKDFKSSESPYGLIHNLIAKEIPYEEIRYQGGVTICWVAQAIEEPFGYTDEAKETDFILRDMSTEAFLKGRFCNAGGIGVSLAIDGYGSNFSGPEETTLLFIERHCDKAVVKVYADATSALPTHTISLEGAKVDTQSKGGIVNPPAIIEPFSGVNSK
jgi:hypothetical protein